MNGVAALVLGPALAGALAVSEAEPPVVEVRSSKRGFRPDTVSLRRGETVRFVLSTADGTHCFAVDGLRVEKRIVPGRETRFDLTPESEGTFPFHCCLETGAAAELERGRIVVAD